MNDRFYKCTGKTDELGNFSMEGTFDIAGELAYQITQHKESLWKHFCKDVCEQVLHDMGCEPELTDFRNVFEKAFKDETQKWKEL